VIYFYNFATRWLLIMWSLMFFCNSVANVHLGQRNGKLAIIRACVPTGSIKIDCIVIVLKNCITSGKTQSTRKKH
jgi:hypothetical protein